MFGGVYSSMSHQPVADIGAQRTLGMGGSLVGYIQTGNAYDKHYYHGLKQDTFVKKKSKKRFDKAIAVGAGILAAAAVVLGLAHKGVIKSEFLSKAGNAVFGIFKKKPAVSADTVEKASETVAEAGETAKKGLSKILSKLKKPKA